MLFLGPKQRWIHNSTSGGTTNRSPPIVSGLSAARRLKAGRNIAARLAFENCPCSNSKALR
jgi:hypothetical protein